MNNNNDNDYIFGRNTVLEALKSGRSINKIMVDMNAKGSIMQSVSLARKKKIIVQEVNTNVLNKITNNQSHQGIVAMISPYDYVSVDYILDRAKEKGEKAFIIIVDGVTDPHNLGALIRTAECSGVHGIIIPKRNAVPVNSTVAKVAMGGAEYVPIARENNLMQVVDYLKEHDIWVYAADEDSDSLLYDINFDENVAIIVGGEDTGVRRILMDNCDGKFKIPMVGKVPSLNASVAGAITMYEVLRQRLKKGL